jgi:hypothetical protein
VLLLGDAEATSEVVVTMLAEALAYAARGWPVFPCKPGLKAPNTAHGFQDATTSAAAIRAWWTRHPQDNVAIATGAPGPDVLDVDVTAEGNGWAGFNRLKRAGMLTGAMVLVRTPRGGLHAYYTGTAQPCGSLTRAGHFIDFKAHGGYVLAPPSQVNGQPYELLDQREPRDLAGRIDWQTVRRILAPPRSGPSLPGRGDGSDIGRLAEWVAALTEGNRNNGLYWAACRAVENGFDPGDLVTAAVSAGLTETEASRTIDSARRASQ